MLVWNRVKRNGDNRNFYIFCCIWCTVCWTYSVNWEFVRIIFIWPWFLLPVLLNKSIFFNSDNLKQMKFLSGVEVYTTKISRSFFLLKSNEILLKKSIAMNLEIHWVDILFEFSLYRFILFLDFRIYNIIIMNVKQLPFTFVYA